MSPQSSISHATLFRLSGLALLLGGVIGTVSVAFHPPGTSLVDARNVPVHLALYIGVLLVLAGLPGLCARLAPRTGGVGLLGTALLFFGLAFEDPLHSIVAFTVIPTIAANPAGRALLDGPPPALMMTLMMVAALTILAGLIVLAIAILRTGALPRWLAAPMLATVLLIPVSFAVEPLQSVGPALLYLAIAGLGYPLVVQSSQPMVNADFDRVRAQPARS